MKTRRTCGRGSWLCSPALLAAFLITFSCQVLHADDDKLQGDVDNYTLDDLSTAHKVKDGQLYKTSKGQYYILFNSGKSKLNLQKGDKVKLKDGTSINVSYQNTPQEDQFFANLALFTSQTAAGLTPQQATIGDVFFSLALPLALTIEGDMSELWGSSSSFTVTDGVVSYKQESNFLFILASLSADGHSPTVFSFNELSSPLDIQSSGAKFEFIAGDATIPAPDGFRDLVVGVTTPEPATLMPFVGGLALLLVKRRKQLCDDAECGPATAITKRLAKCDRWNEDNTSVKNEMAVRF